MNKLLPFSIFLFLFMIYECRCEIVTDNTLIWRVGTATTVITPKESIWMGGYADRIKPAKEKLHDLWAKAIYLQDANGHLALLITCDLIGFSKSISDRVKNKLYDKLGLDKAQIILNTSHTHSGPATSDNLINIYPLNNKQLMLIDKYTEWLCEQLVELSMKAKQNCEPAKVFSQNGTVRFQVNRRNNIEPELTNLSELKGPNDYSVPVLKIEDVRGNIKAIVFGYACHPTVLNGYQWSGDYPGFAQIELEKNYPEVVAMFFQGAAQEYFFGKTIREGTCRCCRTGNKRTNAGVAFRNSNHLHRNTFGFRFYSYRKRVERK